jgi:hypothetical protein
MIALKYRDVSIERETNKATLTSNSSGLGTIATITIAKLRITLSLAVDRAMFTT